MTLFGRNSKGFRRGSRFLGSCCAIWAHFLPMLLPGKALVLPFRSNSRNKNTLNALSNRPGACFGHSRGDPTHPYILTNCRLESNCKQVAICRHELLCILCHRHLRLCPSFQNASCHFRRCVLGYRRWHLYRFLVCTLR